MIRTLDTIGMSRMIVRGKEPSRLSINETRLALHNTLTRLKKREFAFCENEPTKTMLKSKGGDLLILQTDDNKKAIGAISASQNQVILETNPYLPKPLLKLFDKVAEEIDKLKPKK